MEATYLDFRYLQFKQTPSSTKCALISLLAGLALSLPYILSIFLSTSPYIQIQPYYDQAGILRCHFSLGNPYGFELGRYINYGFKKLVPDSIIFLLAVTLWTVCMSFLLNDTKKKWQVFPIVISFGFTLPIIIFSFSIFTASKILTSLVEIFSNPITIYILLGFALGVTFGKKKIMHLLIPGVIGYFLGHFILAYVSFQIKYSQFDNVVPIERIVNWFSLVQIAKNLILNFFIGIGVYATYAEARKLSDSVARFEDTKPEY